MTIPTQDFRLQFMILKQHSQRNLTVRAAKNTAAITKNNPTAILLRSIHKKSLSFFLQFYPKIFLRGSNRSKLPLSTILYYDESDTYARHLIMCCYQNSFERLLVCSFE